MGGGDRLWMKRVYRMDVSCTSVFSELHNMPQFKQSTYIHNRDGGRRNEQHKQELRECPCFLSFGPRSQHRSQAAPTDEKSRTDEQIM